MQYTTFTGNDALLMRQLGGPRPANGMNHSSIPRVAFVLHIMQVAGAEVLVREIIHRLAGQIDPVVLCLDAIGSIGEQLRSAGTPVICLERKPGRDWGVAWRLARELRHRRIDVVHAHQYTPFFYAALARLRCWLRPKLIFTEHGRHFPDVVSPMRRRVNRIFLSRLANAINACSAFSARALAETDGFRHRPIEVIENGIELARYAPVTDRAALRTTLELDPDRRYLLCVARFHPVKDHDLLLRGFARLASQRLDIDLLLAGDGPLRETLQSQADQLGIRQRVRFLGIRSDVPRLLQAVDAFALTSVSEAASLTVLEAMASRLPIVVTAVGGNPEMIRDQQEGLLVPRGDVEALATALLRIFDDQALARRLGDAARQRVEERYQLEQTVERYRQLYYKLTDHASHRAAN
jgi:glycosyltransferase involved in cell wall biosynthesis